MAFSRNFGSSITSSSSKNTTASKPSTLATEQAQIADGAVALKADLFGEALDVLLGHALLDKRQLRPRR